jgi:anti-anti-sigma factor
MTDSPGFAVQCEHDGDGATISISGDVDLATVAPLLDARDRALAQRPSRLLFDLRGVRFIDSSGLKFLLETDRMARRDGWTLQLLRPPDSAMRVFAVTGVEKHLPFVEPGAAKGPSPDADNIE